MFFFFRVTAGAQCTVIFSNDTVADESICINGNDFFLDLSSFNEVEGDFFLEYFIVENDTSVSSVLEMPILAVSEVNYEGIQTGSCNSVDDLGRFQDALIVQVSFIQQELNQITFNPIAGGILMADGAESLQELVNLIPNIPVLQLPNPSIQSFIATISTGTIPIITDVEPCIEVDETLFAPFEFSTVPIANFEYNSCTFQFSNTSQAEFFIDTAFWDLGNGETSTDYLVEDYSYESSGEYEVTLTVCSDEGCDTSTQIIDVPPLMISIPTSAVAYEPVFFDWTSPVFTNQSWIFGDGGISLEPNPEYTYTTPGVYTVELFLTDSTTVDCTLQIVETIEVSGNVGIGDSVERGFDIFPNPALDYATISFPEFLVVEQVVVWNQLGERVFADKVSTSSYQLEVSSFSSGLYIVELVPIKGDSFFERLIVQ